MAIMVVIIHHGIVWRAPKSSWNGIYDLVTNLMGGGICQVAVPAFFLISGWLFFANLSEWNWKIWEGKVLRRVRSLLVPYLLWNIIKVVLSSVWSTKCFDIVLNLQYISNIGLKGIFWMPADFPLWFIRDLILCVIISPLIWYAIKKAKQWFIILLLVFYVFSLPPFQDHLSGVAVPLFAFGGWVRIFRNDGLIIRMDNKVLIPIWIILLLLHTCTKGVEGMEYLSTIFLRLMKLSSVLVVFSIISDVNNPKVGKSLKNMGQCSFWLFAVHTVLLRDLSFLIVWKLLPMDNTYIATIAYFIAITITLTLCFATYYTFRKIFPRTVNVLCGR